MKTKTLNIPDNIIDILADMIVERHGDVYIGIYEKQLDRPTHEAFAKAIKALGGKWDGRLRAQVFTDDPRPALGLVIETGTVEVIKDGFFRTPMSVVDRMAGAIGFDPRVHRFLEPSAGDGAIVDILTSKYGVPYRLIDCVEMNPVRAEALRKKGYRVYPIDFLKYITATRYDRILMNPPFEDGQDIDHVRHAYKLLVPGGKLASVMSEGPFFRTNRKAVEFRQWIVSKHGYFDIKLPDGSFRASGTGVNARIVVIEKGENK